MISWMGMRGEGGGRGGEEDICSDLPYGIT
jgi:hypothetical protein